VNEVSKAKRTFFGNPLKKVDVKPLPKGTRLCFGEAPIEPAKRPVLPPGATVLCYGNSPQHPQHDVPFEVVNETPVWSKKPKE
jgi:hypothetical protein